MRAILVACALAACASPEPLPPGVYRCEGAVAEPIGNYASDVVVADFNGDTIGDVATIGTWGVVNVFLGTGPRLVASSEIQLAGDGHALAAGDFDGDGHVDLAAVRGASDPRLTVLGLLRGRGDGTFDPETSWTLDTSVAAFAISMRAGDLDKDGRVDLVLGTIDEAMILRGRADGSFEPPQKLFGPKVRFVDLGDLDRDGALDLVTADFGIACFFACNDDGVDGKLVIRHGRGDGTFDDPVIVGSDNFASVRIVDLDDDGDLDVLAMAPVGRYVLLDDGLGTLDSSLAYAVGQVDGDALVADLDRDGMLDLVQTMRGRQPVGIYVSYGQGDGTFAEPVTFELDEAGDIAVGDVDGNGAPELFVLGRETLQVLPTRCFVDRRD